MINLPDLVDGISTSIVSFIARSLTVAPQCCWNCGHALPLLSKLCSGCKRIQPCASKDLYTLLDMKPTWHVDPRALKHKVLSLQAHYHPDKFTSHCKTMSKAALREHEIASEISALVNKAYAVLSDDMNRAVYLAKKEGVDVSTGRPDRDLLMEQVEVRETAQKHFDTRCCNGLAALFERVHKGFLDSTEAFGKEYEATRDPGRLALHLQRMKFYKSSMTELEDRMFDLSCVL